MTRKEFTANVHATQEALRRFLTALCCGNSSLADDIAQEAYIKAYLSTADVRDFRPWIFRIAVNTFLSHKRAFRPLEPEDTAANVAAETPGDYQALYMALSRLSEKERTAISLFYMEGYSIKEIAEITDSNENAVKQQLSRGRSHLKTLMPDERN